MIEKVLGKYSKHVEFIGDEIKDVAQVGAFWSQVLHLASFANRCDDIEELIQAGADVNAIGDLGLRPLHYAVLGGGVEAIRILLLKKADVRAENEYGETPTQMAHVLGQADIENLLLEAGGQSAYGFDGGTTARERWLAFKSIQEGNFWTD
ncbi:ankyrin repeat domain-containing protein [Ralstonia syzygii]|uniref:Ankyrin repeat domain-containing protein n=1 Tax=Ralstonia syzygii TaxID=28097 RepID=A0ABX7ZAH4_9RALS|nr:ankyrin repeat domain-containing protein [Ralstonia syzygii]QUP52447.1 ankyrin repeat domain-containing protein [Ralstonia syzygii]